MKKILLLLLCALSLPAQKKMVVVISHRGEHLRHPENTMPAFEEAVRVGADYIEVDVRTTLDGKLVLMHDARADRTTNGTGEIAKMTFDEVRALDAGIKKDAAFAGTKVPSFDEVLDYARGKINVYVDAKQISAGDLVRHLTEHGMAENVVIYSGRISKEVRELNPRLRIMPEARSAAFAQTIIDELHPPVLAFDAADFRDDVIEVAKRGNALIYVDRLGPVDNPAGWQEAIDRGADGIQTDRPGELAKYLRENGYKKP